MAHLFVDEKLSYNQICTARSTLSSILFLKSEKRFGEHPLVKRVIKSIFQRKPKFPIYKIIWNVKTIFDYFRELPHQENLPLKILSKKLVLLMALFAGGQRMRTIHLISLQDIKIFPERIVVPIMDG